jgi:hypothetical protein
LEPLFFDLIEDLPHSKGRAEDGLPHRRHALGMQGVRTAVRDHVSIGSDRPEQTFELVDLVDGDSENETIVGMVCIACSGDIVNTAVRLTTLSLDWKYLKSRYRMAA